MDSRKGKLDAHSTGLITPENIGAHLTDIEMALHLAPQSIAELLLDNCLVAFKKNLDREYEDCKNVAEKTIRNAVSFYHHDGEGAALYMQRMQLNLDLQLKEVMQELRVKYDQCIHEYEQYVLGVRDQFRHAKGYNEAIVLANLKKDISSGLQHSLVAHQPLALDNFLAKNLEEFQNEIASVIKSTKTHKKQLVHDVSKYVKAANLLRGDEGVRADALIFHDKNSLSFTPRAFAIESRAAQLADAIKKDLVSIKSEAEFRIKKFSKEVFIQDHFEKIRKSASDVAYGLQSFKEIYSYKNRLSSLILQDIKEVTALMAVRKDQDTLSQCATIRDGLKKLDNELLSHFDSALRLEGIALPVMLQLNVIEQQRERLREQLTRVEEELKVRRQALNKVQNLPVVKSSSTSIINKKLQGSAEMQVPEIKINGEALPKQSEKHVVEYQPDPESALAAQVTSMRNSI